VLVDKPVVEFRAGATPIHEGGDVEPKQSDRVLGARLLGFVQRDPRDDTPIAQVGKVSRTVRFEGTQEELRVMVREAFVATETLMHRVVRKLVGGEGASRQIAVVKCPSRFKTLRHHMLDVAPEALYFERDLGVATKAKLLVNELRKEFLLALQVLPSALRGRIVGGRILMALRERVRGRSVLRNRIHNLHFRAAPSAFGEQSTSLQRAT